MPEVMRLFAVRLREFVSNRRSAKRFKMHLPVSVALIGSRYVGKHEGDKKGRSSHIFFRIGASMDISASGLAIVVSKIYIDGRYLTDQDRTLLVRLELPSETIEFRASAKRHQPIETEHNDRSFLIGARIEKIESAEKEKLLAYLKS